jgi:hypothetical protein
MEYREPPNLAGTRLDFSEFHPLDHGVWEARCGELPGGRRRHIDLQWTYVVRPAVYAATSCRLGRHNPGQAWERGSGGDRQVTWTLCVHCGRRLSAKQPV